MTKTTKFLMGIMLSSSIFTSANELYLKIGTYTLNKGEKTNVEINIISFSPQQNLKTKYVPPEIKINLKIYNYNSSDTKMYTSDMSELEELNLGTYNFVENLTLFGGMMKIISNKDTWTITYHEAFTKNDPLMVILSKDEYVEFIKNLQQTVMLKKGIADNWQKISQLHSKIQLIQNK